MTTTFQKRQKEMKRIEKRKMKEEKRAQRKLDKPPASEVTYDPASIQPSIGITATRSVRRNSFDLDQSRSCRRIFLTPE
jgi:hypothetical protein